ncbi:MAG: malate dehydrogenase [Coriobacteriales bacterium]|jgi:malate dehydrogenase|nr:malate dehydrogenase [Coriobacteriales bacterium]
MRKETAQTMSYPKVTVVGAGNVGASAALLLALKNLADVVLIDVADGVAKGKALDLMHMRSNEHFGPTITGTGDYADTAGSRIVVVTAGVPRKPGMTREDLLSVNAKIVGSVLEGALPVSPDALYLFVTNPLDVMTNLAYRIAGLPKQRLFGMGGVLDTARFVHAIAAEAGVKPQAVDALVIGAHGEAMVPLPRLATVNGTPLPQLLSPQQIATVVHNTIQGGAAVVELLQTGSAFYAPASSIVQMVAELLAPTGRALSTCARLEGEYGINDVYMCVPARLGTSGVEQIVELELAEDERAQLIASADAIKTQLAAVTNAG